MSLLRALVGWTVATLLATLLAVGVFVVATAVPTELLLVVALAAFGVLAVVGAGIRVVTGDA